MRIFKNYNRILENKIIMKNKQWKKVKDTSNHHQAALKISNSFKDFVNQDSIPNI